MQAVIDRFEGDQAILLLNDGQEQIIASRQSLPPEAKQGDWLNIQIKDGEMISAFIDVDETAIAKQRIADKLARLRRGEHLI